MIPGHIRKGTTDTVLGDFLALELFRASEFTRCTHCASSSKWTLPDGCYSHTHLVGEGTVFKEVIQLNQGLPENRRHSWSTIISSHPLLQCSASQGSIVRPGLGQTIGTEMKKGHSPFPCLLPPTLTSQTGYLSPMFKGSPLLCLYLVGWGEPYNLEFH